MSFKGFDVPNGHTQIPNDFIEMVLQSGVRFDPRNPDKPILSIGEIKIMLFMFRETFGWQRQGSSLEFTFTELMVATYLGKATVNDSLKSLIAKEFIQRAEIDKKMRYRLNIKDYQDYPWDLSRDWKKTFKIEEKKEKRFVNRTRSGSLTEPEAVRYPNQSRFVNRTNKSDETIDMPDSSASLKKSLNKDLNKSLNKNTYLSKIDNANLSIPVKKVLVNRVDRLVSDNIDLFTIENHFNANVPLVLKENQYAEVLDYYLEATKGRIGRFSALMDIGINKYLNFKNKPISGDSERSEDNQKKPGRKEQSPDWYDEEYKQQQDEKYKSSHSDDEITEDEIEKLRKELEQFKK